MTNLSEYQFALQAVQFCITVAIGSLDLYVIYKVVGLFRHRKQIGAWMDRAFSDEGLQMMTMCPSCGYKPQPSRAEQLLRERQHAAQ